MHRDREMARAVRISTTEIISITDNEPDKGSCLEQGPTTPATRTPIPTQPIVKGSRQRFDPSGPVTPIYYRNGGKRLTRVQGSRRSRKGRKGNQVDMQSFENDVEQSELPESPVLQLRCPDAVAEGVVGRGARPIKYTTQFQSIKDKARL